MNLEEHIKLMDLKDKLAGKSTMVEKVAFVDASFPHVGSPDAPGGFPMDSSPSYRASDPNDFLIGKDFEMPIVRPMEFVGMSDIPKSSSMDLLQTQSPVLGYDNTAQLLNGFNQASPKPSGMISTLELAQGLSRAGIGAAAGWGLANVMGTIFSQPPALKSKMATYGAIGGALVNSGLLRGAVNQVKKLF
jgi:hypothetical protein